MNLHRLKQRAFVKFVKLIHRTTYYTQDTVPWDSVLVSDARVINVDKEAELIAVYNDYTSGPGMLQRININNVPVHQLVIYPNQYVTGEIPLQCATKGKGIKIILCRDAIPPKLVRVDTNGKEYPKGDIYPEGETCNVTVYFNTTDYVTTNIPLTNIELTNLDIVLSIIERDWDKYVTKGMDPSLWLDDMDIDIALEDLPPITSLMELNTPRGAYNLLKQFNNDVLRDSYFRVHEVIRKVNL